MSATSQGSSIPDDIGPQFERAFDTIRTASEGDRLIWGGRKQPVEVLDVTEREDGLRDLELRGPNNGEMTLTEDYVPHDPPAPVYQVSNGENANDLQYYDDDGDPSQRGMTIGDGGQQPSPEPEESGETGGSSGENTDADDSGDGDGMTLPGPFDPGRIRIGEGELIASGTHEQYDAEFTAVFNWSEADEWRLDQEESTIAPALDQSTRGAILADIENGLREADFEVGPADAFEPDVAGQDISADDPMENVGWELTPESGDEFDPDDWARRMTGDFLGPDQFPDKAESFSDRVRDFLGLRDPDIPDGWTFVDELRGALGVDVPKLYNNWVLIDHGFVQNAEDDRMCVWANVDTKEVIAVVAQPRDGNSPNWAVYHTHKGEISRDDAIEPIASFMSDAPSKAKARGAMDTVRQLMGADAGEAKQYESHLTLKENPDGSMTIIDNTDKQTLGRRVAKGGAGALVTVGETVSSAAGAGGGYIASWMSDNWTSVGKTVAYAVGYAATYVVDNWIPGGNVELVWNRDAIGFRLTHYYESEDAGVMNRNAQSDYDVIEDAGRGAVRSDAAWELTIDPRQYLLYSSRSSSKSDPVFNIGAEQLIDLGKVLGLDDAGFQLPDGSVNDWFQQTVEKRDDMDASDTSTARPSGTSSGTGNTSLDDIAQQTQQSSGGVQEGDVLSSSGAAAGSARLQDVEGDDDGGDDDGGSGGSSAFDSEAAFLDWSEYSTDISQRGMDGKMAYIATELMAPKFLTWWNTVKKPTTDTVNPSHVQQFYDDEFWPWYGDTLEEKQDINNTRIENYPTFSLAFLEAADIAYNADGSPSLSRFAFLEREHKKLEDTPFRDLMSDYRDVVRQYNNYQSNDTEPDDPDGPPSTSGDPEEVGEQRADDVEKAHGGTADMSGWQTDYRGDLPQHRRF